MPLVFQQDTACQRIYTAYSFQTLIFSQVRVATRLRRDGIAIALLQISCMSVSLKNSESRSTFGENMDNSLVSCVFRVTLYHLYAT